MPKFRWNLVIGALLAGMLAAGVIVAVALPQPKTATPEVGRQAPTPLPGKADTAPSLSACRSVYESGEGLHLHDVTSSTAFGAQRSVMALGLRTTFTSPSTPKIGINHGHGYPLSARTSSGSPSQ